MMKIGVIPDSFQVPFKEAVILARDLGAKGLQPYVTSGELAPENLSKEDRADILKFVKSNGLVFSALCADFGLHFNEKGTNEEGIKRTMAMMDLALDFDTRVITTHIGKVPADESSEEYENIVRTIERLGKYGDEIGVAFATETGPEKAPILKKILDKANTKSAKVNLDPANFVMCSAQDPAEAVYILKDYIVHTHAKDGIMIDENSYQEKILGEGDVNFPEYLAALKDIGYDGFLTIEREAGATRFADIKHAVSFLSENLKKLY
ncbi:MAG: sugar phosphate isomerase/epimerase [Oscillospiraceae bacterium]|nr:sugar phosphate isomerase/epimerase [Oscillospiraceae bacterium]